MSVTSSENSIVHSYKEINAQTKKNICFVHMIVKFGHSEKAATIKAEFY